MAILSAIGKWVGTFFLEKVWGFLAEAAKVAMATIANMLKIRDDRKTTEENAERLKDSLEAGADEEIVDASEDLLNGRRR